MKKIIETFEEGCKIIGIDPAIMPGVTGLPEKKAKAITADYQLSVMRDAQNKLDKFVPNYSDRRQWKWYGWLWFNYSVGAFVFIDTRYTYSYTNLGSRFCFEDANTAEKFWTLHIGLFNDIMQDN